MIDLDLQVSSSMTFSFRKYSILKFRIVTLRDSMIQSYLVETKCLCL